MGRRLSHRRMSSYRVKCLRSNRSAHRSTSSKRRYRAGKPVDQLCGMDVIIHGDKVLFMIGDSAFEGPLDRTWVLVDASYHDIDTEYLAKITDFSWPWIPTEQNILLRLNTHNDFWVDVGHVPYVALQEYEPSDNEDEFIDVNSQTPATFQQVINGPSRLHCIPYFVSERRPLSPGNGKFFKFKDWGDKTPYEKQHHDAQITIGVHAFNPKTALGSKLTHILSDTESLDMIGDG